MPNSNIGSGCFWMSLIIFFLLMASLCSKVQDQPNKPEKEITHPKLPLQTKTTPTSKPQPTPTYKYTGIYVKSYPNPNNDFNNARPKQIWRIDDLNIVLLKSPTISPDKWTLRENIVATIQPGEFITILSSKGTFTVWHYVSLSPTPGGPPRSRGWLLSKTISTATNWD